MTASVSPHVPAAPALRAGDRVLVIVNPAAWRTRHGAWDAAARAALGDGVEATWHTPASVAEVATLVARAAHDGTRAVIVAGGDGTVSRAIERLAGTQTLLGLLPLGTGNDLARQLGIPADPVAAAPRLREGTERVIDLVTVNGQRPFATVGLVGLTALSAVYVARLQAGGAIARLLARALGRQAYRVTAAASLVDPRRAWRPATVWVQGPDGRAQTIERDIFGCFIANGRRLGSGLVLPADAQPDDGVFEVCVVRRVPRPRLIAAFTCFALGWRLPRGVLDVFPATRARIDWPERTIFSADGENLLEQRRFDLEIRPGALRVIA